MATQSQYHRYLFLGKISGSLTPGEEEELQALFAEDAGLIKEYEELEEQLASEEFSRHLENLKTPGFWRDIPGEIRSYNSAQQRKQFIKISGVAVLLAGVLVAGWWFLNDRDKGHEKPVARHENKKGVQLRLANGKTIDLSTDTGTIVEGGLTILNTNNSLEYTSGSKDVTGTNVVEVPTGMTYQVNLSDGSKVWMNSETHMEFPSRFDSDQREVYINGEAYIEVAKDVKKPFIVKLPNTSVKVTGTEFNVNSYDTGVVVVSLVEGGVNMAAQDGLIKLEPGRQGIYNNIEKRLSEGAFDSRKTLSWREGLYYFNKASLKEISAVIKRWYGVNSVIDSRVLEDKKFVGILHKNKSLEYFLDNLKNISRMETYFDGDGVLHFR